MSSDTDSEIDEHLQDLLLQRLSQINDSLLGDDASIVSHKKGKKGREKTTKLSENKLRKKNDDEKPAKKCKKGKKPTISDNEKDTDEMQNCKKKLKHSMDTEDVKLTGNGNSMNKKKFKELQTDKIKHKKGTGHGIMDTEGENEIKKMKGKRKQKERVVSKMEKDSCPEDLVGEKSDHCKKTKPEMSDKMKPNKQGTKHKAKHSHLEPLDSAGEDLWTSEFTDDEESTTDSKDDSDDFSDDQFSDDSFTGQSDDSFVGQSSGRAGNLEKRLEQFKEKLGLTKQDFEQYRKKKENIGAEERDRMERSLGAQSGGKKRPPAEVVVFEDPAKRKKGDKKKDLAAATIILRRGEGHTSGPQFNLFSAKNEVQKFGIQGLDEKTKEEATVDLLVSLGAKKPKNTYVNYKEYMNQQKQQKQAKCQATQLAKLQDKHYSGSTAGSKKQKNKRKDQGEFGDGQIGSYRQGVQVIGKGDVQKIKNTRTSKRRR